MRTFHTFDAFNLTETALQNRRPTICSIREVSRPFPSLSLVGISLEVALLSMKPLNILELLSGRPWSGEGMIKFCIYRDMIRSRADYL